VIFLLIVGAIPVCALAWWWWADRRVRGLGRSGRWRIALAAFVLVHAACFGWLLISRTLKAPGPPEVLLASTYIWSLIVLPVSVAGTVAALVAAYFYRRLRGTDATARPLATDGAPTQTPVESIAAGTPLLTRRQALATVALVGTPVIAQGTALTRGISQLDEFRVREIVVRDPTLARSLDGLTIAHVSDTHVGRFTRGKVLRDVAERVSSLDADLVCFTGDLIDYTLADLPEGLAMLRDCRARHGLYMCEGNHDLFDDRERFRRDVRRAGINLLVNESDTVEVRGGRVQLVGLRWGADAAARQGAMFGRNLAQMSGSLDAGAYQILLSHHPHAFDDARALGIPLTLAGHTHGGQLNFAEGVGLVRYAFRYMSGLYTRHGFRGPTSCVVSNGVGNWFPLRINAPAEIIRVTLRRADPELSVGVG